MHERLETSNFYGWNFSHNIWLSTLVFAIILTVAGIGFSLIDIGILVVALNVGQWLLAPYLIGWIYKVKELKQDEKPELHQNS